MSTADTVADMQDALGHDDNRFPCSLAQQRFWFLEQMKPGNPALNISVRWRMEGSITDAAIQATYIQLMQRHEILRTIYSEVDGEPVQILLADTNSRVSVVDLTRLQPEQRAAEAERISMHDAQRPIAITSDIPVRMTSLRLDDRNVMILLTVHHIAADGVSMGILAHEFGALLAANVSGRETALAPLEMQFADYALWQRDMAESGGFSADAAFWTDTLRDAPYFEVAADRARPATPGTDSDFVFRILPTDTATAFEAAAPKLGQTLFNISTAALTRMLLLWTGRDDVTIGTQVAGRDDVLLEPVVGLFINTIVLRFPASEARTGRQLIEATSARIDEALAHRQFPFEMVVQQLNPRRDASRTPLFSVNYTLIRPVIASERFDDVALISLPSQPAGAQYDLAFFMVKRADGWRLTCESSKALYDASTIERMLTLWEQVLSEMVRSPDADMTRFERPVAGGPLVPAAALPPDVRQGNISQVSTSEAPVDTGGRAADDVGAQIRQVWCELLNRDDITDETHFFDAGGHSLLALRLLSRVKAITGQPVAVATLFQHPTFHDFITIVEMGPAGAEQNAQTSWLSKSGTRPPVIAINDGAVYHPIAQLLPDRAFIDINVVAEGDQSLDAARSMETFARDALKLVQAAQPHGPYTLMGHCVMGALAFEVAQQLLRRGETVSLVVMLDSLAPGYIEDMSFKDRFLRKAVQAKDVVKNFGVLLRRVRRGEMSSAGLLMQYGFIRRQGFIRLLERLQLIEKVREGSEDHAQVVFGNQLMDARRRHRCIPYAGDVLQFRAMTARDGRLFDKGFGWGPILTGRYDVVTVPSDHFNMMREPSANVVAATLTTRLDEIERDQALKRGGA